MNNSIIVNITELKKVIAPGVKVNDIKNDLISIGAEVLGSKDENGNIIMVINGDVDFNEVEAAFDDAGVTLEDFIIEDDDFVPDYDNVDDDDNIPDYDSVEVEDEVTETLNIEHKMPVNEKKKDCCPKKTVTKKRENTVNLYEALKGKQKPSRDITLDEVINSIVGMDISKNTVRKAMDKARFESKKECQQQYLMEKLGTEKYQRIIESLEKGQKSLSNFSINGKNIADYTIDEIGTILEKVTKQIEDLESKLGKDGLNETENAKLQKTLELRRKLAEMLNDEIDFRNALKEADDDAKNPFRNVDTVPTDEKDEEKADDAAEESDETDENSDEADVNPDEDETVELSQIVITLSNKDAAEDMKQDLLDAGVPEDAIEIEKADDEETSDEESDEEPAEEEKSEEENDKQEESVKANGAKLNEADDEKSDEEEASDEKSDEEDNSDEEDAEKEETEEEAYKLILTDTEYVTQLADVLQNIWGMSNDEFNELIGGEFVTDEEDEESDDKKEAESDEGEEDFDPEDIFKGL